MYAPSTVMCAASCVQQQGGWLPLLLRWCGRAAEGQAALAYRKHQLQVCMECGLEPPPQIATVVVMILFSIFIILQELHCSLLQPGALQEVTVGIKGGILICLADMLRCINAGLVPPVRSFDNACTPCSCHTAQPCIGIIQVWSQPVCLYAMCAVNCSFRATDGGSVTHGSHTASTAAGNHGIRSDNPSYPGMMSGMAPAARLAIYKVRLLMCGVVQCLPQMFINCARQHAARQHVYCVIFNPRHDHHTQRS
jgi:hypothetical protein